MTPDAAAGLADLIGRSIIGCTCERFTVITRRDVDGDPIAATVVHVSPTCPALLNMQLDYGVGGDLPDDSSHLHGPDDGDNLPRDA
ncbi:hypothetical protein [Cellulomonas sp. P5_E12]